MCKVLGVTESGFYRWLRNTSKPAKRELLLVEIKNIIGEAPENRNYGTVKGKPSASGWCYRRIFNRKSKNISLSNLVIFSTIQILTSPKTRYNTHMLLWILLAAVGVAGVVSVVWIARKRNKNQLVKRAFMDEKDS